MSEQNPLRAREIPLSKDGTHSSRSPLDPGKPFGVVDTMLVSLPEEVVVRITRPLWTLVAIGVGVTALLGYVVHQINVVSVQIEQLK